MRPNVLQTLLKIVAPAALLALVACGGGGDGDGKSTGSLSVKYTDPAPTGAAAIVTLNRTLSTGSMMVFEVVGYQPATQIAGVSLNLQIDPAKLTVADIPGTRDLEVEHLLATPTASPASLGATAVAMRKDRADGYTMMASAIRRPNPSVPGTGVILRFAYKIQGTPVEGVIRTQVMDGSGLLDAQGGLISGTAPVFGRLEYVRQ